jgi:gamma-glutamyltranspeptidase
MLIAPPFGGGRAPVLARNTVASSQPLATQAGIEALQSGGNAVDAALATAITLTVVEPTMNGLGGDSFAILWDGKKIHGLNASGRAPAAWTPEYFAGKSEMDLIGWKTVTVPGMVAGWVELSKKFGKLPFAQLFKRAIDYAENGFPVSPVIARQWLEAIPILKNQPGFTESFLIDGKSPQAGQIWKFPAQAKALKEIAATQGESFYKGSLAQSMVDFAKTSGGCFTMQDFADNKPEWVEPLAFDYGDYTLHEIPPNGSGIAAQIALGILQAANVKQYPADSAQRIHLQVEAMRMAFADAIRDILYTLDPLTNNGLHLRTVVDDYGWDLAKQDNEIRRLLQVLGTEVGRNVFGDDVWVDVLISKLEPMDKVVITDVRFPNEARELHNLAGEIWRVNREGVSAINEHVSESQMDEYNFDKIIDNNGSLEDLEHAIVELIEANNE